MRFVFFVRFVYLVFFVRFVREVCKMEPMTAWPAVHNPFSTSFGSQPPLLVGRDDELALIRTGLGSGPGSKHFGTVILGRRGYGKTVILGKMRDEAQEHDWPVIEVNCSTGTALQEMEERGRTILSQHYGSLLGKLTARVKGGGVSVLGAGAHLAVDLGEGRATSFSDLFVALGAAAMEKDQGILLLVDEMHNFDSQDMRVLAATIQHVTNSLKYPIAYIGAGLPQLEDIIIGDDAISFFHRCDRLSLGAISEADAAQGIAVPIRHHGGEIPSKVLDQAVAYVDGYPYKLQMLGHHLWNESLDAGHQIGEQHLEIAKTRVDSEMDKHIYGTIWKLISVPSRKFVHALLEGNGTSTLQDVQKLMKSNMGSVERCRDELASHSLVEHDNGDWVRLTETIPRYVLGKYIARQQSANGAGARHSAQADAVGQDLHTHDGGRSVQPVIGQEVACGLWMPRKRAYCVLVKDHSGRCRSQMG